MHRWLIIRPVIVFVRHAMVPLYSPMPHLHNLQLSHEQRHLQEAIGRRWKTEDWLEGLYKEWDAINLMGAIRWTIARMISDIYDCPPALDCYVERVPLHNLLGLWNGPRKSKRLKERDSIICHKNQHRLTRQTLMFLQFSHVNGWLVQHWSVFEAINVGILLTVSRNMPCWR